MQTKVCTRCQQALPLGEFYKRARSDDGLQPKCRSCERARKRELRGVPPEEQRRLKVESAPTVKPCSDCRVVKPLTAFPVHDRNYDGRRSRCKKCDAALRRTRGYKKLPKVDEEFEAARSGRIGRVCTACLTFKPYGEFFTNRYMRDGVMARCKDCANSVTAAWRSENVLRIRIASATWRMENSERHLAATRAWQAANPDRVKATRRAHYYAHREAHLEYNNRRRATIMSRTVGEIDLDALWTGQCGICCEPIDRSLGGLHPMSKSLDHITPLARGGTHEQGNLQWAHLVCNMRKGARSA